MYEKLLKYPQKGDIMNLRNFEHTFDYGRTQEKGGYI